MTKKKNTQKNSKNTAKRSDEMPKNSENTAESGATDHTGEESSNRENSSTEESSSSESCSIFKSSSLPKILISILLILVVLFVHFRTSPDAITDTTEKNTTISGKNAEKIVAEKTVKDADNSAVKEGDTVLVQYIGKFENSTVFDTSRETVAKENNMYIEGRQYEPLPVTVGKGQVIKGFDAALLGMKVGDDKTVTIPSEEAYGLYDDKKEMEILRVQKMNRTFSMDRRIIVSPEDFERMFNVKEAVVGQEYKMEEIPWQFKVTGIKNNITIESVINSGDEFVIPGSMWKSLVKSADQTDMVFYQMPENGQVIETPLGKGIVDVTEDTVTITANAAAGDTLMTMGGPVRVKKVDGNTIILDMNHPLAGKTLVFDLELVEIK